MSHVVFVQFLDQPLLLVLITIQVIDTNNKKPECDFVGEIRINEETENGFLIPQNITCKDDDRDEQYNTPWFKFPASAIELKNLFSIEISSGKIFVNKTGDYQLDRDEGKASYVVSFIVSDNFYQEDTMQQNMNEYSFTLILNDINDNEPIIETSTISGSEKMEKNAQLGVIVATDLDEPKSDNTKINFKVLNISKQINAGADPPLDLFHIVVEDAYSGKGNIFTNYDLRGFYGTYTAVVQAFDFGTYPKPQLSKKEIKINIEQYNFLPPVFTNPSPTNNNPIYLSKVQAVGQPLYQYNGTILGPFTASDQQNEKWNIEITIDEETNLHNRFGLEKVGQSGAQLYLNDNTDFSKAELKLIADCKCQGLEPFSASIIINIRFIDSDTEPEYESNEVPLKIKENSTGIMEQLPIAYFNKEGEEWDIFPIYYFLVEDVSKAFVINKTSAKLTLINLLDREKINNFTLKVYASKNRDGNPNPHDESILHVLIEVIDLNDNIPNFEKQEYYAGVNPIKEMNSSIITIRANDADFDEVLAILILPETLQSNGTGIATISNPFTVTYKNNKLPQNVTCEGNIHLNFAVQSYMKGYFTFQVKVVDNAAHKSFASVKIYIVSESTKVVTQFTNSIDIVLSKEEKVRSAFENNIGYRCNIDAVLASTDDTGATIDNQTDFISNFVNDETNEAIDAVEIERILADVSVFLKLSNELLEEGLYLLKINNNVAPENSEELLRAWLIGVSVVLGTFCVALIFAFIIKTRSLLTRLNKLSVPKFGSTESGLNRVGLPNTNIRANEGANPVFSEEKKAPEYDEYSIGSGDSDLIGIEDNPNFEIKRNDSINSLFKEKF